ncbi:MAG: hypothetical protein ACR2O8_01525 [Rhizobiaceae bacterium]
MSNLNDGVTNLLVNCAEVRSGETLLIVCEETGLGWYDRDAPQAVAQKARKLGLKPSILTVDAPGQSRDPNLLHQMSQHDLTIFFARVGDQDRFSYNAGQERSVMVYARDGASLASQFGQTNHRAMIDLKKAVDDVVFDGKTITITCPLGTEYAGNVPAVSREDSRDVTIKRFPLGVPQPVPATGFSGRVALAGYLTPTGSKPYNPASCRIDETIMAYVKNGRIREFRGPQKCVDAVKDHYRIVSQQLGIDPHVVHSWHAGIHPGSSYLGSIHDDPDRWSNNIFTHPRFLHFHTCGAYAPGEICWMVQDPTITIDGKALWENGNLRPNSFEATSEALKKWDELRKLFDGPSGPIGIPDSSGHGE